MTSWRLSWVLSEFGHSSNFAAHHRVLRASWKYWLALVLKFFPYVWPFDLWLALRGGARFRVEQFMTLFIYREIFVDRCYDLPFRLPPKPVIVDVGSNTGLFILRMKQLYPDCVVAGFEPLPANCAQLRSNLQRNHIEGISVFECGVGGSARRATLYVHSRNIGGNSIYQALARGGSSVDIEIINVEQMLLKTPDGACDLLKLDCEGAEFEIIKSITEQIGERIKTIVFEPTPDLYEIEDLLGHLEQVGYEVKENRGLYMAVRKVPGVAARLSAC